MITCHRADTLAGGNADVVDNVINGHADDDQIALPGRLFEVGLRDVDMSAGGRRFEVGSRRGRNR